ncbi:glutathione S-transferase [Stipitochalara longipes BDJ]|nr:glutathione S-transferase [Stipitochalara longipes BDJ]
MYFDSVLTPSNGEHVPKIKLYYAPGACSLAPHILLHEIDAKFEAISNTVTLNEVVFAEELPRLNPKLRVPVLSLDGEVITETPAITTAIAGLAPDMYLNGKTPLDTIRVHEWMIWLAGVLHGQGFGGLLRPERLSDDPGSYEGIRAKAMKNIKDCYDLVEGKLIGVHAVGDSLTAVDTYLFVFYRWGNDAGFKMKDEYPKYTALVANLVLRPAAKAVLTAEGIGSTL